MACSKTDTTARIIRSFQETGKKQLCREGLLNLQGMRWNDSGRVYLFSGFQVPISYLVARFCTVSGALEEFPLQCPLHGQFDVVCDLGASGRPVHFYPTNVCIIAGIIVRIPSHGG